MPKTLKLAIIDSYSAVYENGKKQLINHGIGVPVVAADATNYHIVTPTVECITQHVINLSAQAGP